MLYLEKGIDCEVTFALVMRIASIRLMLTVVIAHSHLKYLQMDGKITFLNVDLDDKISMEQLTLKSKVMSIICAV